MDSIHFKLACAYDFEWVFSLKSLTERKYIEPHFGWDETYQRGLLAREWALSKPWLIANDAGKVGTICYRYGESGVYLNSFYILPEFQRSGIGTRVLTLICERLNQENHSCELAYLKGNPVQSLYHRFGFFCSKSTRHLIYMRRRPHPICPK